MASHRIDQVSAVETVARQTPKADFGSVLSQTVEQVARVGAGIVGGALGSPVVSAAITTASAVLGVAGGNRPMALAQASTTATSIGGPAISPVSVGGPLSGGSGLGGLTGAATGGDSWALMQAQQQLQSSGQSFELQYLQLQDQMNKESQTFTAVSNIMKVRADAAKNAINNIH